MAKKTAKKSTSKKPDVAGTFAAINSLVNGASEDVIKFVEFGNSAAGARVRKAAMEVKRLCSQIRKEVQDIKNSSK